LSAQPSADLLTSTLKAAADGPAAAMMLAQGVLLSMRLTRLSSLIPLVLALAVLTAGVGFFTTHSGGVPEAVAVDPAPAAAGGQRPAAGDADRDATKDEVQKKLLLAREQLEKLEVNWTAERIRARTEQAEIEEALRALDQDHTQKLDQRRREARHLELFRERLADRLATLRIDLNKIKATTMEQKELYLAEAQIQAAERELQELDQAIAKINPLGLEHEYSAALLELRKKQIQSEESLQALERKQNMARATLEADIEALEAHRRQLDANSPAATAEGDLHKKLDRLLKEVTELRQELKKSPSPK
jgi:DNA repair exonuclease SbcCD ATPase subunit